MSNVCNDVQKLFIGKEIPEQTQCRYRIDDEILGCFIIKNGQTFVDGISSKQLIRQFHNIILSKQEECMIVNSNTLTLYRKFGKINVGIIANVFDKANALQLLDKIYYWEDEMKSSLWL